MISWSDSPSGVLCTGVVYVDSLGLLRVIEDLWVRRLRGWDCVRTGDGDAVLMGATPAGVGCRFWGFLRQVRAWEEQGDCLQSATT
jgi:hypothetical protein